MGNAPEIFKCPYCGADNGLESEFCGVCYKQLHIPAEVRAEAKIARVLRNAAAAHAAAEPAAVLPPRGERAELRLWARAAIIAALFMFYTRWLPNENYFSPLDLINLWFHEAGHIILGFFGHFIMMAGGTVFQLLVPALCLAHLRRRGANLGWQICLFWLGENMLNISIYAGDAVSKALPLVGGGDHDWAYLLGATGLTPHVAEVSSAFFLCGSAVILFSLYLIGRDALARKPIALGDPSWEI